MHRLPIHHPTFDSERRGGGVVQTTGRQAADCKEWKTPGRDIHSAIPCMIGRTGRCICMHAGPGHNWVAFRTLFFSCVLLGTGSGCRAGYIKAPGRRFLGCSFLWMFQNFFSWFWAFLYFLGLTDRLLADDTLGFVCEVF
ncbi:hypothetical protein QBC47DRAFT_189311 [Echria macrotheca]|uniref:Uncharacterized protein n=1 Tax=Echria macrotheca TaxID=438768 RepID=A0AAJ0BDS6_9PEZI|nr:hypothetical protein QBC47DRAFT_189311 [Echria macrotheca]